MYLIESKQADTYNVSLFVEITTPEGKPKVLLRKLSNWFFTLL